MRKHPVWKLTLVGLAASALAFIGIAQGYGQQKFPFPNNTVIRLIVPFGPGGGFDRVTRIIQPSLQKALNTLSGQHVTVIVVNKPGAGAQVATEYAYSAPPDGTRLLLIGNDSAPVQQLVLGAKFRVADFTYIGRVNESKWGILVRTNTRISDMKKLIARAQRESILVGTSGAGSGDQVAWLLTQAVLKHHGVRFPLSFVNFSSSPTVFASMQRNEAEAYFGSLTSLLPATDAGYAKLIVVFSKTRSVYYPNVSTAFEQHVPGAEAITSLVGLTRMFVGPPNIPNDRARVLRQAFRMALSDPTLLGRAKKARVPIIYGTAEQARAAMISREKVLSQYQSIVKAALHGKTSK